MCHVRSLCLLVLRSGVYKFNAFARRTEESIIFNPQSSIFNPQSSIFNPQSSILNPQSSPLWGGEGLFLLVLLNHYSCPSVYVRFDAVLDAAKQVEQFLRLGTWLLAIAKHIALASFNIIDA